jgi:hypothetical protein
MSGQRRPEGRVRFVRWIVEVGIGRGERRDGRRVDIVYLKYIFLEEIQALCRNLRAPSDELSCSAAGWS